TPSLESIRVLTLGIRATFLASRCFHSHSSSFHICLKQFPQLLKDHRRISSSSPPP
ncbi:hypothetical protein GW17_00050656, partial [Ensete ventricosum]